MAYLTDFTKMDVDNTLTWTLQAAQDPQALRYNLSYRKAGGAKTRVTQLPVHGADAPLTNAKALADLINSRTACLIGSISATLAQNADQDVPARTVGTGVTKTFWFRVRNAAGTQEEKVGIAISDYHNGSLSTDADATLAAAMSPYIKVFANDDVVDFTGCSVS